MPTAMQDAHEFLYFLFNEISEVLEKSEKEKLAATQNGNTAVNNQQPTPKTWVHELFQGTMVNEMRCMQCETVTSREEAFYDLSLEIEHNSSVTSCLRNFRLALQICDLQILLHTSVLDQMQLPNAYIGHFIPAYGVHLPLSACTLQVTMYPIMKLHHLHCMLAYILAKMPM